MFLDNLFIFKKNIIEISDFNKILDYKKSIYNKAKLKKDFQDLKFLEKFINKVTDDFSYTIDNFILFKDVNSYNLLYDDITKEFNYRISEKEPLNNLFLLNTKYPLIKTNLTIDKEILISLDIKTEMAIIYGMICNSEPFYLMNINNFKNNIIEFLALLYLHMGINELYDFKPNTILNLLDNKEIEYFSKLAIVILNAYINFFNKFLPEIINNIKNN